ncbi:MAG: carbohydrate binding domain-containing protein [Phycisphaeraceae bacterium]|nr:carbohydrate binding domain-containing protein [Phycisphaeraceae bacterium]
MIASTSSAQEQVIKNFTVDTMLYTSSEKAAAAWRPMQGALAPIPATVDGVRCLTLPCHFRPSTQRALWEKDIDVDLTQYNYLYFRFKAPDLSAIGNVAIYLQSGDKGWYLCDDHTVVRLLTDQWMTALIPIKAFREVGEPAGWEQITKMRISIWQRKDIATSVSISDIRFQKIDLVNLVHNSGFEYASIDRHPDYWGPGHWGLREGRWTAKMDQWRETWRIDDTVAHQGKNSLRVVQTAEADILEHRVVSTFFPTTKNKPYTFSAWLKSDQPNGQEVELKIYTLKNTWVKKTFTVTHTWKRYEVGFTPKKTSPRTRSAICPTTQGTLWIDSVQAEAGTTATTYQPAFKDITIIGHAVQNNEPAIADYPIIAGSNTGTSSIDTNRRFLVDGKPFIPTTVGWDKEPTPNAIRDLALSGFNTLCFTAYPSQTVASLRTIMDNANTLGLKITQH